MGSGVIQYVSCGPNMHVVICLCGGILEELTKLCVYILIVMVSGTSDDQGKANA